MSSFEASVRANTTQFVKDIKTVASKTTVTVKVKPEGGTDTITSSMTKTIDASNKLTTSIKKVDGAGKLLSTTMTTSSKAVKGMGRDFLDTLGKVAKFGAVTAILGAFTKSVTEAIRAVKEFDKAQTDYLKVSDLSGEALDNYTKKLGDLGASVARTTTEMILASSEFKKSGYTDEQSAQLAKVASMFQNVADSEISAGDSASFIISQMKAFNISAEDSMSIIDSINEVSNTFAVSSTDISSGLTKASASMATYGNTSSQTIGLISAGTEIMTGQAGKISRGLISVGANLIKLADGAGELKYAVDGTTKSIKLFDKAGELKSTYQILSEISEGWNQMSTAEQSSLAVSLAG